MPPGIRFLPSPGSSKEPNYNVNALVDYWIPVTPNPKQQKDPSWRTHWEELPEREQRILVMRFYGNLTQTEIGERLGISQMHVSRLLARALSHLKSRLLDPAEAGDTPQSAATA